MSPSPSRSSKSPSKSKTAQRSGSKPSPRPKAAGKGSATGARKAAAKPAKKVAKAATKKKVAARPAPRPKAVVKARTKAPAAKVSKKTKAVRKPAPRKPREAAAPAPKVERSVVERPPVSEPAVMPTAPNLNAPAPMHAPLPVERSPADVGAPPRPDRDPSDRAFDPARPSHQPPARPQHPGQPQGQPQNRGPRPDQRPSQQQPYPQRPPQQRNDQRGGPQGGGGGGGGRPPQQQPYQQRPPQQQQQQQQRPRDDQRHWRDSSPDRPPASRPPAPPAPPVPPAAPSAPAPVPAATVHHDHHHVPAGPTHPARDEIFDRGVRFADLGLRDSVLKGITEAGFEYPTAIQARIIPVILAGKDVLGQAKTGTGKTAAFGLPLLHKIEKGVPFQALVLVPTRELAIQVATDLKELGRFTPLHILPVYGGQNVKTQAQYLAKGPEIIVATPGRVMDMVQRGYINYRSIKAVVLDEVDRMLDIGFRDDIRRILSTCPRERQTIFVSATIHSEIEALARSFARDCEKIIASAGSLTVSLVKQWHLPVQPWDKKQLLLHLLTHEEPALTVVFCRTKKTVDNLAEYLQRKGVDCHAIHGDMYQNKRNKVMEQLRAGKLEVLIASDVASRGLDIEGITHVINYDLPEDPDLYVHRIGRTARAGRTGVAWSLVTPEQGGMLTQIELLINAEIPKLDYPDFKPGPLPQDVLQRQQSDQRRVDNARQFNRFSSTPAPGAAPAAPAPGTGAPKPPSGPSGGPAPKPAPPPPPDLNRFPGGIVPTMAPPKRMFGKVKTARSMKAAIQQAFTLPPKDPAPQPEPTPGVPAQTPPAD